MEATMHRQNNQFGSMAHWTGRSRLLQASTAILTCCLSIACGTDRPTPASGTGGMGKDASGSGGMPASGGSTGQGGQTGSGDKLDSADPLAQVARPHRVVRPVRAGKLVRGTSWIRRIHWLRWAGKFWRKLA